MNNGSDTLSLIAFNNDNSSITEDTHAMQSAHRSIMNRIGTVDKANEAIRRRTNNAVALDAWNGRRGGS